MGRHRSPCLTPPPSSSASGRLSYLSLIFFGTLHSDGYIFLLPCTISINRAIMLSRLTVVYIIILLCSKHFDGSFAIRVEAKILTIFIKCKYNAFNNVSPVYSYYCTYPLTSSHADFFDFLIYFYFFYFTILYWFCHTLT